MCLFCGGFWSFFLRLTRKLFETPDFQLELAFYESSSNENIRMASRSSNEETNIWN